MKKATFDRDAFAAEMREAGYPDHLIGRMTQDAADLVECGEEPTTAVATVRGLTDRGIRRERSFGMQRIGLIPGNANAERMYDRFLALVGTGMSHLHASRQVHREEQDRVNAAWRASADEREAAETARGGQIATVTPLHWGDDESADIGRD